MMPIKIKHGQAMRGTAANRDIIAPGVRQKFRKTRGAIQRNADISRMQRVMAFIAFALLLSGACSSTSSETAKQTGANRVMDDASILSPGAEDSLFAISRNLESEIGSQIVVLTINSLNGEKIETYTLRKANELRLGRATHNDGILITVAHDDRQVRIEVGKGLETVISDDIAAQLIRTEMVPKFRQEKFGEGLYLAVEKISKLIRDNKERIGHP